MGSAADYSSQNGEHNRYTYTDYLSWEDDQRRELINGRVWAMSPAPTRVHQELLMELSARFHLFLKGKPCKVYPAPFDVRLPREGQSSKKSDTVVQPDISVVCDPSKLDDAGCIGAPDLVAEIVSRYSAARDQVEKLRLYEGHQVREYWIVHPEDKLIRIYRLGPDGTYDRDDSHASGERAESGVLKGFSISTDELFGSIEAPSSEGPDTVAEPAT